jgi:hypothetical protein
MVPGVLCLLLSPAVRAAGPPGGRADEVGALARRIDRLLAAGHAARKVTPAPRASDAAFVRRAYLDLAGRIPRVAEVRTFLADRRPDKRRRLVDRLLAGPHYINHFSHVWRTLLLPLNNNQQVQFFSFQVEAWARKRLRDNVPYDRMVRELLTTPVAITRFTSRAGPDQGALAFYRANEMKAENIAAATSRLFLGVKLECAQCHDHPFARWTRRQFWEYTAFFAGIRPTQPNAGVFTAATEDPKVHEVAIPGSEKKVQARFLDGAAPRWADSASTRATLAEWVTAPDNPFFARTAANRMWEHFFGIGLVDPADDFRDDNPASHPELLDLLARELVRHKFDLTFLIRAITASDAYGRSSTLTHDSQRDPRAFAIMALKGLTPEQVFDSLAMATGYRENAAPMERRGFGGFATPRAEFLAKFANPVDRRTEHQTSILQALALMNGKFIADATSVQRSEVLAAVLDSPFLDHRGRLDTLFLAALARPMRPSEAGRLVPYVTAGGPTRQPGRALADVFWVLLNSSEFIFNH